MPEGRTRFVRNARVGTAAIVAVALVAGIYVTLGGEGNRAVSAACKEAEPVAAALDPLVGGELAAFQVADSPKLLSDLGFKGANGEAMTLGAFQGKVALVNLWATWCGPCKKEMPALGRLEAALGGAEFSVAPISIDTADPERPAAFLKEIGVENLPLYTDRSTAIFEELKVRGIAVGLPVTVLLDRNGCSLGHINGPAEWDSPDGQELIRAAIAAERSPES